MVVDITAHHQCWDGQLLFRDALTRVFLLSERASSRLATMTQFARRDERGISSKKDCRREDLTIGSCETWLDLRRFSLLRRYFSPTSYPAMSRPEWERVICHSMKWGRCQTRNARNRLLALRNRASLRHHYLTTRKAVQGGPRRCGGSRMWSALWSIREFNPDTISRATLISFLHTSDAFRHQIPP